MSLFTYINILRFRYHVQFWNAIQIQCFEAVFFSYSWGVVAILVYKYSH